MRIFDAHATLAALDQLVDVARERADERATRFGIILRQTQALLYNPSFQHLLLKLIGSKEEVAIAKEIQKALKQSPPFYFPRNSNTSRVPPGRYLGCVKHKYVILVANGALR